jgi:hypothetical protein
VLVQRPSSESKTQVRGLVDLRCHYANTPAIAMPPLVLAPLNTPLRFGAGDR